jgi:hypothetical protein
VEEALVDFIKQQGSMRLRINAKIIERPPRGNARILRRILQAAF